MGYKLTKMREIRRARNITLTALAKKLGCHRNTLASYERGDSIPQLDFGIKIADALRADVYQLIGRTKTEL